MNQNTNDCGATAFWFCLKCGRLYWYDPRHETPPEAPILYCGACAPSPPKYDGKVSGENIKETRRVKWKTK